MPRLSFSIILFLVSCFSAEAMEDITAQFIPAEVQPGDVFEFRVERESAGFGTFVLDIPRLSHLHRIATESIPVAFDGGRYLQRESWFLQADASGEYVIEGASAIVTVEGKEEVVALAALDLRVVPYSDVDSLDDPVGFPEAEGDYESKGKLWLILICVLAVGIGVVVWRKRLNSGVTLEDSIGELSLRDRVIEDLKSGTSSIANLEALFQLEGSKWLPTLRDDVERILYSNSGDAENLLGLLEKEEGE